MTKKVLPITVITKKIMVDMLVPSLSDVVRLKTVKVASVKSKRHYMYTHYQFRLNLENYSNFTRKIKRIITETEDKMVLEVTKSADTSHELVCARPIHMKIDTQSQITELIHQNPNTLDIITVAQKETRVSLSNSSKGS